MYDTAILVLVFEIVNVILLTKHIHTHFNNFGTSLVVGSYDVSSGVI